MLGVLAVPPWMTPSDFLSFVAPAVDNIGHLRIIRYALIISLHFVNHPHTLRISDFAPNRSIVIIKFLNPAAAAEFAEEYNGKPFNSMEVSDMFSTLFLSNDRYAVAGNLPCRSCPLRFN